MMGWKPIPSHVGTIVAFLVLFAVFLSIGIFLLGETLSQQTYKVRYDTCPLNEVCVVHINVSAMQAPIIVSYEIDGFYQNMRGYSDSYSDAQLSGKEVPISQLSKCGPAKYNANFSTTTSIGGQPLDPAAPAYPCGVIAVTFFNDSYKFTNNLVAINESGIAWPNDRSKLYKAPANCSSICWVDPTNEHFIVWSQIAPQSHFRKIWGRLDQPLPAGNYSIEIENNYNVSGVGGKKYFVLSQDTKIGGQELFLPIVYLISAGLALFFCLYFFIHMVCKKK
ncbi:uncharacterized protein LOC127595000 [Hippocampus zosterae]|uniref:uncharacterized protein LOC127595000 n=1 Tax=Hippocampus zosterae TaxID=109293 RepID=UPI00223CBB9F|nr:uncharacterized protein LOC127595000 [Hippocampus zosterae]